jgi:hypothetical protein
MEERGDEPDPTEKDPLHCGLLLSLRRVSPPSSIRGTARDRVFVALLGPVVQEFSALEWSRHSPPRFTLPHSSLCPAQVLPCYMIGFLPSGPLIFPIPLARETHSPDVPGVANRRPKGRRMDVPDPEKIQQDRRYTAASFSPPLDSRARCASVHLCLLASLRFERRDTPSGAISAPRFPECPPTPVALPFPRLSSWTACWLSRDSWSRLAVPPA